MQFPDVPKLELDQLIDQLIERAQDVKRTQGRLRALLGAIETITSDLDLERVLRNIVEAACELASATYAALGVVGADGLLEQFVHVGLDAGTVARIGALPQGRGLLGSLITDPHPVRLGTLADDGRSSGFPPGHPPMTSFLGVPIEIHGAVFGNLYLTDSTAGEFSAEDEELVVALALAAGAAITNARLYEESQLQQRWLSASVEIGNQLLTNGGEDPLSTVARRAMEVAGADRASVSLVAPEGDTLLVEVAFGAAADEVIGRRYPLAGTLAGKVVRADTPLLAVSASGAAGEGLEDESTSDVAGVPAQEFGPVMIVPLAGDDQPRGVLSLVRNRGRRTFTSRDLEMASGFANHASIALELADSRAAEQRVALLEERDRIARDLHDHVIQELFAIGMSLESVAALLGPEGPLAARVQQRVEDIDRTIRRIRTSIFALRGPLDGGVGGVRQLIMEIVSDLTPALGYPPHVSFAGQLDFLDEDLTDDIAAVVRELLTNVAKHARASQASVDVVASPTEVTVTATDNGCGIGAPSRRSGTANLGTRAERRAGTFTLGPAPAGGTQAIWKAPLT